MPWSTAQHACLQQLADISEMKSSNSERSIDQTCETILKPRM